MAWKDSRPMSPHLQIYKLPLTALISVAHRGTGVALCAGMVLLVWAVVAAASGPEAFACASAVMSSWFGKLVMLGFIASLYIHLCNGIRHLVWDAGKGYELDTVARSSKIVIGVSLVLTVITWLAAVL